MSTIDWDGSPISLAAGESAVMAQTPTASMFFTALNEARVDDSGMLALSSGGAPPSMLNVPALTIQPVVLMDNWQGSDLVVANVSVAAGTPIEIQACAPGIPSPPPADLPVGSTIQLQSMQAAEGTAGPNPMLLRLQSSSATSSVIGAIGGPMTGGSNGYLIGLNAPANTGVPSGTPGKPTQSGYYATTTANTYTLPLSFGGAFDLYVVNLSSSTASPIGVTLQMV
jgi:hypothetical protein